MKRATILCLLGGLFTCMGATGNGCAVDPDGLLILRKPPVVLSTTPVEDTRQRTLEVDLRNWPETDLVSWEFGDGAVLPSRPVGDARVVTHEFVRDGTFVVTAHLFSAGDPIAQMSAGWISSGSLPIDIVGPNVLPIAAFVAEDAVSDDGVPESAAKRFTAIGSRDPDGTIEKYRWDFGDGTAAVGQTVDHAFSRSGRFPVRLTVTDNRGGKADVTRTVLVNSVPVPLFTFEEDGNNAMRFNFDAAGSTDPDGDIQTFEWNFGDDSAIATGQTVSHTFALPNDYSVTLTVIDAFGARVSTTQVVDVVGDVPFVRSITPSVGEPDTILSDAVIDGERFQTGATVRLERGGSSFVATSSSVQGETTITATFDLSGAATGDYDVIVENPDSTSATLTDGFRVVTANRVRLTTSMGDIVLALVDDAPVTTANFLQYVEDNFYDGTIFHRVVSGFVVQGGGFIPGPDLGTPQDGLRDPIVNEFSPSRSNLRATVAMAKLGSDPDSATSQFFFNLGDNSGNLDNQNGGFTVFATVVEGMDVVDAIAGVDVGSNDRPVEDVMLISAVRE